MILDANGKKLRRGIGFLAVLVRVTESTPGPNGVDLVSCDQVDIDEEDPVMTIEQPTCTKMS